MEIKLEPVESSLIAATGYDPASNTLAVQFKSGDTYHYEGVPPEVVQAMDEADSVGKFFGQNIRSQFQGKKLAKADDQDEQPAT